MDHLVRETTHYTFNYQPSYTPLEKILNVGQKLNDTDNNNYGVQVIEKEFETIGSTENYHSGSPEP